MNKVIHKLSNNRIIFKTLNRYKNYAVKKKKEDFQKNLTISEEQITFESKEEIFPDGSFLKKLIYKNEDWEIVKNRFHDRFLKFFGLPLATKDNDCSDSKNRIEGNNLLYDSKGLEDDWIYYYLQDYTVRDYELKLDAVFNSHFREIQFGFRYLDFYNRYRFRIENGLLHFDIVYQGQFYNSFFTKEFNIQLNVPYQFHIVVKGNQFSFVSNNKVIMTVTDKRNLFSYGAVALILWEDNGQSNIKGQFNNIIFNKIV